MPHKGSDYFYGMLLDRVYERIRDISTAQTYSATRNIHAIILFRGDVLLLPPERCRQVMPSLVIWRPSPEWKLIALGYVQVPKSYTTPLFLALKARRGIVISAFRMVVASPV